MRWVAAVLVLVLAAPAALACTATGPIPVAVLRVQEADGAVLANIETRIAYPGCSLAPDAAFSGPWVAWRAGSRIHITDWTTGTEWDGDGDLPFGVPLTQAFGLVNDTFVTFDEASGVARWLDLRTGATGQMTGLTGYELFGGMATAVRDGNVTVANVRQGVFVAAVPVSSIVVPMDAILSSNAAYTVVYDEDEGGIALVHHATGASDLMVHYEFVDTAYLDDGHVAVALGSTRYTPTPWSSDATHVYREPFDDGPTQVVHVGGTLAGHSKGLYLFVARGNSTEPAAPSPDEDNTDPGAGDEDEILEIPPVGVGALIVALAFLALRRR